MKLTQALKNWAVANLGVKADATDAEFNSAILGGLSTGKLTAEKMNELLKDNTTDAIGSLVAKSVDAALAPLKGVLEQLAGKLGQITPTVTTTTTTQPTLTPEEERVKATLAKLGYVPGGASQQADAVDPNRVLFRAANGAGSPRVKGVAEKFSTNKSVVTYPDHGAKKYMGKWYRPNAEVKFCGDVLHTPTQLGKAVAAAYFKWSLACANHPRDIPRGLLMNDEDRDLMNFALHELEWSGVVKCRDDGYDWEHKVARRKLTEMEIKSLLDDSISGGIEIAPIEFDDALVTVPVLYGELFPLVNVVDVSRGRRMKGGSVSNPTFASSQEGTAIQAFDTTSFVSAFDTAIYVAAAAMEIGMDFEEDSPTNIGTIIMDKYGEKAQEWLDMVIAIGDGTTQPQGIFNAAGTTSVPADMGTGGPATVSDYESLMFTVAKQYRGTKGERNIYLANETTYRRARAIPVGPNDERRVFGMTHADFMLLDTPYKINNQPGLPNTSIAYGNMGYYRMYRRLGFNVRVETGGNYLATKNLRLIVVRMRYGGKVELGGAFSVCLDAQS